MKTIRALLFLITTLNSVCYCQWVQVGTVSTIQLNGVKFLDQNTGVAAGIGGLWRSTNGGVNWTHILQGMNLNDVSFHDSTNGYAVGDTGRIFSTYDRGYNWTQQGIGLTNNNLNGVAYTAVSTFYCFVVGNGGIFMRTFNRGSSWEIQFISSNDFYSLGINTSGAGFAVGTANSEFAMRTGNGGTNWTLMLNQPGNRLFDVRNIHNGFADVLVGTDGRIRRTSNGGINWTLPISNTTDNLYGVDFPYLDTGYIVGFSGTILRSTDRGNYWSVQNSPTGANLNELSFINPQTGWAVGDYGIVLKTTNGGLTPIETVSNTIPREFSVIQNYPNPFNSSTKLEIQIARFSNVRLVIYDALGRQVSVVLEQWLHSGIYGVRIDASNLSSGIYFYEVTAGSSNATIFFKTKKFAVLK